MIRPNGTNAGIRSGLFDPKHYARMGNAVWLFGWLVDRQTREKDGVGYVLGGRPLSSREIAKLSGFPDRTVRLWTATLLRQHYLRLDKICGRRDGFSYRWVILNAKKWSGQNLAHSAGRVGRTMPTPSAGVGRTMPRSGQNLAHSGRVPVLKTQPVGVSTNSNYKDLRERKEREGTAASATPPQPDSLKPEDRARFLTAMAEFKRLLSKGTWETWIRPARLAGKNGLLKIGLPNRVFARIWREQGFLHQFEKLLGEPAILVKA